MDYAVELQSMTLDSLIVRPCDDGDIRILAAAEDEGVE